ncbi:ABC-type glutathione transport system ATPase component [Granulicella aggregans]|uniref:Nickel import system ATP-binding protein NikD n=1 Tax=Granulicella aggregans TaxID=474949 RepID=A0A7W8E1U4_9BACT|nr:ABC transporter ATP-binding protein [Granulicella aggregans]MBB5055802.1 ABC-type glutathione transport system ATPase component [Granulicella aggregans]
MKRHLLLKVDLQARYGDRAVLKDVRFELEPGEALALVGTSGAGKSTIVLSLLGLLPWRGGTVKGEVLLDGLNLLTLKEREWRKRRGYRIALIPQSPMSALNPPLSLLTHFAHAWKAHNKGGQSVFKERLNTVLTEVQLPIDPEFLARRPSQISVGQAQRVLIALALLHRPAIIIADEPTSALDPVTQNQIVELLRHLTRLHGTALLYISHDLVSVVQLCDRMAVLDAGEIVETLAVKDLGLARHPMTRALLGALPVPVDVLLECQRQSGVKEFSKSA